MKNKIKQITKAVIKTTAKFCAESTSTIFFYEYRIPDSLKFEESEAEKGNND